MSSSEVEDNLQRSKILRKFEKSNPDDDQAMRGDLLASEDLPASNNEFHCDVKLMFDTGQTSSSFIVFQNILSDVIHYGSLSFFRISPIDEFGIKYFPYL
ncbi:hypothetical protein NPIL_521 [Nephila pilipes]|uniref:Uncharacterized protein n=1 Tax=Nephila pilipes TaxID=299642 RepID=A0A8X6QYI0_NEPPI|nr:hypothetical protein NPIL_521 [Nephila pilipes]